MQLYIGNKNYSSWSLRAWLALAQLGIPFDEIKLRLDAEPGSEFKNRLEQVAPTGKVPVLVDDGFAVWETVAIVEYVAEKFPHAGVWPADRLARARARTLCAEMHAGFSALRNHCGMNIEADFKKIGARVWEEQPAVRSDMQRIESMWSEQLANSGGPFLFGPFCAADAFFAPVCSRIRTYGLPVGPAVQGYVQRIFELPAMQAWVKEALAEHDFIAFDEPYRKSR